MSADPKPTSSLRDVMPPGDPVVHTAVEADPAPEGTGLAYAAGAPIIGPRDDQQLPDTDKGISG